ncbi:MAG TPA: glutathione binding-like protein [Steroidobacteraceae bacterium]|nr:glutathione S-transferase N-terminal domain-containing protein [Steroidobacteraceae bacterium]HQW07543.1 glutathione binding-like protein [Steroidobacteraceae bacterium]
MIELHYWPTPNGHKITLFLEETGLEYRIVPVDIGAGEQFKPDFLAFSPNNRMPAIIDRTPAGGGEAIGVFESGAILVYLAEKTGHFLPADVRGRKAVLEWLFWQMGGLGPMSGQAGHFLNYAQEQIPYAQARYSNEVNRLYGVLDRQLAKHAFVAGGDYSIADMAIYPWAVIRDRLQQDIAPFPALSRWLDAVKARPATQRAYAKGELYQRRPLDDAQRKVLFGQTAASVSTAATTAGAERKT